MRFFAWLISSLTLLTSASKRDKKVKPGGRLEDESSSLRVLHTSPVLCRKNMTTLSPLYPPPPTHTPFHFSNRQFRPPLRSDSTPMAGPPHSYALPHLPLSTSLILPFFLHSWLLPKPTTHWSFESIPPDFSWLCYCYENMGRDIGCVFCGIMFPLVPHSDGIWGR